MLRLFLFVFIFSFIYLFIYRYNEWPIRKRDGLMRNGRLREYDTEIRNRIRSTERSNDDKIILIEWKCNRKFVSLQMYIFFVVKGNFVWLEQRSSIVRVEDSWTDYQSDPWGPELYICTDRGEVCTGEGMNRYQPLGGVSDQWDRREGEIIISSVFHWTNLNSSRVYLLARGIKCHARALDRERTLRAGALWNSTVNRDEENTRMRASAVYCYCSVENFIFPARINWGRGHERQDEGGWKPEGKTIYRREARAEGARMSAIVLSATRRRRGRTERRTEERESFQLTELADTRFIKRSVRWELEKSKNNRYYQSCFFYIYLFIFILKG